MYLIVDTHFVPCLL